MNLKITSEIETGVGINVTNAICLLTTYPIMNNEGGLDVSCDINTYVSNELRLNGYDKIYPIKSGSRSKVATCKIILTQEQALGAGLPLVIYQQVAIQLANDYGWTVIVEQ